MFRVSVRLERSVTRLCKIRKLNDKHEEFVTERIGGREVMDSKQEI